MHLFTDIQIITDLHERNVPIFAKGVTSLVSADPDPRPPRRRQVCTLRTSLGRGFVHCDFRRWRLCALVTLFCRGYVHWSPPAVRKPPPKRRLQCARPDRRFRAVRKPPSEQASQCARPSFVHCGPHFDGAVYTGLLDAGGFVHWRPRSGGTLYTGPWRHCTNLLRNSPSSAHGPTAVSGQCANPHPNRPPSAHGPTVSSGHRAPP